MKPIVIAADKMRGAPLVAQDTFEGKEMPDVMQVRRLRPGMVLKSRFRAEWPPAGLPFVELVLTGFPGSFLCGNTDPIYQARESILFDLAISLNGRVVFEGKLYNRSHPNCDPLQETALKFPTHAFPLAKGMNTLTVENRTGPRPFAGMEDYYISRITLKKTSGRLINKFHAPDALDGFIDANPLDDLKSGVGYETIPNRDVLQMIEDMVEDRVGNFVMLRPDNALNDGACAGADEILGWVRSLAAKKIYFSIMLFRAKGHAITPAVARRIVQIGGRYFVSFNHHELGLIYGGARRWREEYLKGPVTSLRQASEIYLAALRKRIRCEIPSRRRPVMCSESMLLSDQNLKAGIDFPIAETPPMHTGIMLSSARGAARAAGKTLWGVHVPLLWSLGNGIFYGWDQAKVERFRLAVTMPYLGGARIIYPESGLFNICATYVHDSSRRVMDENSAVADSPIQQGMRRAMRNIRRMHAVHRLPADPATDVAFMRGNFDPFVGKRRGGPVMEAASIADYQADSGWELLRLMFPGAALFADDHAAVAPWFSGSPLGQCDIVPASAPAHRLARYRAIIVPGWNTMDADTYVQWRRYVRDGGMLVACASQLRVDERAGSRRNFFRAGDVRDLFGARLGRIGPEIRSVAGCLPGRPGFRMKLVVPNRAMVVLSEMVGAHSARCELDGYARVLLRETGTGEPVLVERRLGRGRAFLFTAWEYLGNPQIMPLAKELVSNIVCGIRSRLNVAADSGVAYYVYRKEGCDIVAALDTDWSHLRPRGFEVAVGCSRARFVAAPGKVRFVCHRDGIFIAPFSQECGAVIAVQKGNVTDIELTGFGRHAVELAFPGRSLAAARMNGRSLGGRPCGKSGAVFQCELNGSTRLRLEWG